MAELTFLSQPRASLDTLRRALQRVSSPAADHAASLYAIPVRYGLDPAIAWAFCQHEHQFFTDPDAATVRAGKNWGAIRKSQGYASKVAQGFAWYRTYEDGLRDWCELISKVYIPRGLVTVEQAIPVYAPSSDGNRPAAYVAFVREQVAAWAADGAPVDPWASWGMAFPLAEGQQGWAIPQAWHEAGGLGAATSAEIYIDQRPGRGVSIQTFDGGWICYEQATGRTTITRRSG